MTRIHLVADDLTGALDSAAQFTGLAGDIPVLLQHEAAPPPGSFALTLACRDGGETQAVARTRATMSRLEKADIAFKKIDSLLRGHWASELAVLVRSRRFARIILAPAFPAQGRITREGRQHARDPQGRWTVLETDPALELGRRGIEASRLPGHKSSPTGDPPVTLCDGASEADLDAVVRRGRGLPGPTLWVGTAGLARALAGQAPRIVAPAPGAHLVIVGSHHPVTRRQVAVVSERHPAWLERFDVDGGASAARINRLLAQHGRGIVQAGLPAGLASAEAAERIDRWLASLVPHLDRAAFLTIVGGETFASLCRATHACSLCVQGEWRPGVPASRMVDGRWNGIGCLSKSGAFGGDDLLLDLLQ